MFSEYDKKITLILGILFHMIIIIPILTYKYRSVKLSTPQQIKIELGLCNFIPFFKQIY